MRAGRLDRLIDIQRKSEAADDYGQPVETWAAIASRRPASYRPLRGSERFASEQFIAREQVEFRVRYSLDISDVDPLDRIIYPALSGSPAAAASAIYDIIAVHEIGRREGFQIIASRRPEE